MALSQYEKDALKKLEEHKENELSKSPRRIVPTKVQQYGADVVERSKSIPGAAKAREKGSKVFESAATGAARFMTRTSQFTTSSERVVKAYDKKGHQVSDLADIRNLDLRVIDKVAAFRRLQYAYAGSVAVEGAASGFAVSGGQALLPSVLLQERGRGLRRDWPLSPRRWAPTLQLSSPRAAELSRTSRSTTATIRSTLPKKSS